MSKFLSNFVAIFLLTPFIVQEKLSLMEEVDTEKS